jgi:hypothetical protein
MRRMFLNFNDIRTSYKKNPPMAKSTSLITLRGTLGEITFVKSPTYGDHVRAARGTRKKAEVNATFKSKNEILKRANIPAKMLNDVVKRDAKVLGGRLWSKLVQVFMDQLKESDGIDFSKLQPFEVHPRYRFDRFLALEPSIKVDKKKRVLMVTASYGDHPTFERSSFIDGYQLTVTGIFPDLAKKTTRTVVVKSEMLGLTGNVAPLDMQLDIPRTAKTFIVCIKIEGCVKGKANNTPATQGMRVVRAGVV